MSWEKIKYDCGALDKAGIKMRWKTVTGEVQEKVTEV